jgi:hypothetical protein
MPTKSKLLVQRLVELHEANENLRSVLLRYDAGSAKLADLVEDDVQLLTALESLAGPLRRSEVTDAVEAFEASRHQVRLAMFALSTEQGSSFSDMARALGISRQLASRLAAEARETPG